MAYQGNAPATVYTSTTKDSFSGDASTTDFTLSKAGNNNSLRVVVENVVQDPGVAYTCVGTTLSFTSAPPTGTNNIYVVHLGPPAATISPAANTVGGLFKGERGEIGQSNAAGDIFRINEQTLNTSVTIDSTENASCAGPLTVATGVTLTVNGNLTVV